MVNRSIAGITVAALLALCPAALFFHHVSNRTPQLEAYRQSFPTMGTVATFTLYAPDRASAVRACQAARAEFQKVLQLANLYDKNSELARLNQTAQQPFSCTPELWQLLMRARQAYFDSDGQFDITIKPLMDLWGFYRKQQRIPAAGEIAAAMAKCGFKKLEFDFEKHTVRFTVPGMALDLGGIAKGYAADRAAEAVIRCGIERGVIDLGGNLKLLPLPPPGKKGYNVGIRNPSKKTELLPMTLELPGGSAVASSGDYERFVILEGRRYGHIINPATGLPAANPAVTVCTKTALDADIFSTSAYLGGKTAAEKLQKLHPGSRFYFVPFGSTD